MDIWLEKPTNTFMPWDGRTYQDADGNVIVVPSSEVESWTEAKRNSFHLFVPAAADAVPSNKIVSSTSVQRVSGVVKYVNVLTDKPVVTQQDYTLNKALPYRRASDDEAEILRGLLQSAPARLAGIFDGEQYLHSADPLFQLMRQMIIDSGMITAARVDELLAPE